MSILAILAKILKHQAELASILANPHQVNVWHREQLHLRILGNQADFQKFVDTHKINVTKRKNAPVPVGVCKSCLK